MTIEREWIDRRLSRGHCCQEGTKSPRRELSRQGGKCRSGNVLYRQYRSFFLLVPLPFPRV